MKAALAEFSAGVEDLRRQIKSAQAIKAMAARPINEADSAGTVDALLQLQAVIGSPAELSRYNYNATIVTLYGRFEHFIEELIGEAVSFIASIATSRTHLPGKLVASHVPLTIEVLAALQAGRYRGAATMEGLVHRLHLHLTEVDGVHLNEAVYAHHTANFRSDTIRQSFERMGFSPATALGRDGEFLSALNEYMPDEANPFFVIDDLTERRNEVAHGAQPQQLLTSELLGTYLAVTAAYARALHRGVASWLTRLAVEHASEALGRPDKVFNRRIAGFASLPREVVRGAVLGVITEERAYCVKVTEVQVSGVDQRVAPIGSSVGLLLTSDLSARSRIYLLSPVASSLVL